MIDSDRRLSAALGLAAALALSATVAPAAAEGSAINYPPSRSLADVAAWLQRDTPISPAQVVDISPSAVAAVVAVTPTGEPRGFLATIDYEAMNPEIESHDGIASWSIPVQVDCDRRAVRLGMMTGFRSRDLQSDPKVLRPADANFVTPTPSAPLGSVIRALCDRDFRRPLMGGRFRTASKAPDKAAKSPVAPADAPAPAAAPKPAKPVVKTAGTGSAVSVQVGASSSLPDAQDLLARLRKKSPALLAGLTTDVATVEVEGKTVNRALISGFATAVEAAQLCEKLKAGGQACFVRR
ncbi:SPOR domain-containing protein [Phenylobacterium sp.]|uniref:SPOR domain-containing protein n=1 Tax=Phenylobacterium sp. TaxID=1871053 RepID=UPI0035648C69